jgi:hypothetical protein
MPTNKRKDLVQLAAALKDVPPKKKQNRGNTQPHRPPAPYLFKPGQSGNPNGRPKQRPSEHARQAVNQLAYTSPPKELCEQIGVDPKSTWVEAIVFSLGKAAANGDVSAARELLANLGMRGTVASSLVTVNVEDPESMGLFAVFCRHMAGIAEADYPRIWTFMQTLAGSTEMDGECMPPKKQLLIEGK